MADIECLLHSGPSEGLKIRLFGGNNLPPLIEIGLTDLPKLAPLANSGTTGLQLNRFNVLTNHF